MAIITINSSTHFNHAPFQKVKSHFLAGLVRFIGIIPIFLFPVEQAAYSALVINSSTQIKKGKASPLHQPLQRFHSLETQNFPAHHFYKLHYRKLPIIGNGQEAMPSNANNFHGVWNASVDPRTGKAFFSLVTASMLYHFGQNKYNLVLSYSGTPVPGGNNSFGLGPQWSWNVGTEHASPSEVSGHKTTDILTGDGHGFTMVNSIGKSGRKHWHPLRHKMNDVIINGQPDDWTISLSTGKRIHLLDGYEDWEESEDGNRLWFYYDHEYSGQTTRHLAYICTHQLQKKEITGKQNACRDHGIWITYHDTAVTIHGHQTLTLHLNRHPGFTTVSSITMPSLSSKGTIGANRSANIHFTYDENNNLPWLLHSVSYPTGMSTTFLYNGESNKADTQIHGLPTGMNGAYIPVVTEQITHSGILHDQDKHLWFQYNHNHQNEHNYTGYQLNVSSVPGRDNLLDREDAYTYEVTRDNGLTRTITTYNKYHLPLKIIQIDDSSNTTFAESTQGYLPWKQTRFAELPPNYSMATRSEKKLFTFHETGKDVSTEPATVIQERQYNDKGQPVWQRDATGREFFFQYCPPTGDSHCPEVNPDWPQTTYPEKILELPAKKHQITESQLQSSTPTASTEPEATEIIFDYTKIPDHHEKQTGLMRINAKTVGTIPAKIVQETKQGDILPDLNPDEISTRTLYQYDITTHSPFFGQLTGLTLTKHLNPASGNPNKFLHFITKSQETAVITILRKLNPDFGTQDTTIKIASSRNGTQYYENSALESTNSDAGVPLGTTSYSLSSGAVLSNDTPEKNFHVSWTYDLWGRPESKTITPLRGGSPKVITWQYVVSKNEIAAIRTNPDGNQQKTVTDPEGKILSTWHRFQRQSNEPMEGNSNWIQDSETTYNLLGKPKTQTVWAAGDSQKNQEGKTTSLTTTFGYDILGRPAWKKMPDGQIMITIYDDAKLRFIQYELATGPSGTERELGPVFKVVQANRMGKPVDVYTLPVDTGMTVHGRPVYPSALKEKLSILKKGILPASTLKNVGSYGLLPLKGKNSLLGFVREAIDTGHWLTKTHTAYDGNGRIVSQTQPDGATTYLNWKNGNLIAITTPSKQTIQDGFDLYGHKISRCVKPAGSSSCHVLGERGYNSTGNLLWQTDQDGHVTRYTYDHSGRMLSMMTPPDQKNAHGHIFTWEYNSIGPIAEQIDGHTSVLYSYDPKTWRLTDKEDRVSHLHYEYDQNTGLPSKIIRSSPFILTSWKKEIRYPSGTQSFRYDRYAHPTSFTDIHGNRYTATHDTLGRISGTWVQLAGQSSPTLLTTTTYDIFGHPKSITNGAGIKRTFRYNALGKLSETTDSKNGVLLDTLGYTYDSETGNIISFTRQQGHLSATQHYRYDSNNNLVDMSCSKSGTPDTSSLLCPRDTAIGDSGLHVAPMIISQHYDFDQWNNIQRVREILMDNQGKKISKTITYSYAQDNVDQISPETHDPHRMTGFEVYWSTRPYSAKPHVITYDTLGRIIKDADGNTLHYDAQGQQDTFINAKTGQKTRYIYDNEGHQIAEQPFSPEGQPLQNPLYLLYSGSQISAQQQQDASGHNHVSLELTSVAHSEDGKITRWYLHDYKGDTISAFNSSGQQIENTLYSPYGMQYDLLDHSVQTLPAALQRSDRPWWQAHKPGFNGEMSDPATGYQFLGGGYRAFNPVYRHFMTKDSFSPFKKIDGYGFGDNNPIMHTDPTGHLPKWAGYLMGGLGIGMSIGLGIIMPVYAAGTAMGTSMLVAATIGSVAAGILGTASGSLQIASTAHARNKALAISNETFGLANGIATLAIGAIPAFAGVALLMNAATNAGKLTGALIIASGASGTMAGALGVTASSMGAAALSHPDLASRSGFGTALYVISGASMLFMVSSLITGIGAGISAGVKKFAMTQNSDESALSSPGATTRIELDNMTNAQLQTSSGDTGAGSSISLESSSLFSESPAGKNTAYGDENITVIDKFHSLSTEVRNGRMRTRINLDITALSGATISTDNGKFVVEFRGKILTITELKALIMQHSTFYSTAQKLPGPHVFWKIPGIGDFAEYSLNASVAEGYLSTIFGNHDSREALAGWLSITNPKI